MEDEEVEQRKEWVGVGEEEVVGVVGSLADSCSSDKHWEQFWFQV